MSALRIRMAAAGVLLGSATAAFADGHEAVPQVTDVVETTKGEVQGFEDEGIEAFLGIPYAAPPVADLRFKPPQPAAAWEGIYDATSLGAPCMQMYSPSGSRVSEFTRQMQVIFPTAGEAKIDNEDCLFLNVWTPASDGEKRPVMVWFHGGGYAYGSGGWPAYDGRNLAEKGDVVVVTVNHRLNAFGYTHFADGGEDFAGSGNAGNLDLVASLEWVRDNIAAFGGDPDNVTIMGESGGGSKVSHMLATPAADGLFDKAIIQSGPGVTSGKPAEAAEMSSALMAKLSVSSIAELQAVPAETLLNAARAVVSERAAPGGFGGPNFGPIADGTVLPRDPFIPAAPEQSKDVPVMIGWNKDEMTLFVAAQPWFGYLNDAALDAMAQGMGGNAPALIAAYREENPDYSPSHIAARAMGARFVYGSYILADQKARQGGAPVYVYRLDYETPVNEGIFKSPHTLDIPFMFDNVEESRVLVGPGEGPEQLAAMMSDAWISFARTGTPESELLPDWPAYSPQQRMVMTFDTEPAVVDDPEAAARKIMSSGAE